MHYIIHPAWEFFFGDEENTWGSFVRPPCPEHTVATLLLLPVVHSLSPHFSFSAYYYTSFAYIFLGLNYECRLDESPHQSPTHLFLWVSGLPKSGISSGAT